MIDDEWSRAFGARAAAADAIAAVVEGGRIAAADSCNGHGSGTGHSIDIPDHFGRLFLLGLLERGPEFSLHGDGIAVVVIEANRAGGAASGNR